MNDYNLYLDATMDCDLTDLINAYSNCLEISRNYADESLLNQDYDEIDIDKLAEFLQARSDLFESAEKSIISLQSNTKQQSEHDAAQQRMLTDKVIGILEEMTAIEGHLAEFLNEKLSEMKKTLDTMNKTLPVFKHYGEVGGKIGAKLLETKS